MDIFQQRIDASNKHFNANSDTTHFKYDWVCKNGHRTEVPKADKMSFTPPSVCKECKSTSFKMLKRDET